MTKKELEQYIPKFRIGALSIKKFYSLSQLEKNKYISFLLTLEPEVLDDCDKHILRFHSIQPEKILVDDDLTF